MPKPLLAPRTSHLSIVSRKDSIINLGLFLVLASCAILAIYQHTPPHAQSPAAPETEFSSGRAMKHLRAITQQPHPMGALEHAHVREYILGELAALGVNPQVQEATVVSSRSIPFPAGSVSNVIARLNGTANTKAVLLVGHYDSVQTSFGSNDDGSAVVTMLETLRALKASSPLSNDVIALFTDGEEAGLLGAKAFIDEHPWAKEVGVVLNLEARGSGGPVIMFETSNNNGWLVSEFARTAPHPVASSLTQDIYKYLPNDTDLTIFKKAGYSGLNFAYINGITQYHTLLDSFENAGEQSIQHAGSYAFALTRRFGNLNLESTKASDAVYFDFLGLTVIHYPQAMAVPLAVLVAIFFSGVVAFGFRKGRLSLSGIIKGWFACLFSLISSAVIVTFAWWLIRALHTGYKAMPWGEPYNSGTYAVAFVLLAIAVNSALYVWFQKRVSVPNLTVGAMFWWLILMILSSLFLRGGSYLFAFPLVFSLIGLGLVFAAEEKDSDSVRVRAASTLCALPAVILLVPIISQIFPALTLAFSGTVIVLVVLLLGLLIPHFNFVAASRPALLPGAFALISLICIVVGGLTGGFSNTHPETTQCFYALNGDTGKAMWVSGDEKLNSWTASLLTGAQRGDLADFFPLISRRFSKAEAPTAPLAAPDVALLDDRAVNGIRTLRLRITSPRQAPVISVQVDSNTEVEAFTVNGKRTDLSDPGNNSRLNRWGLRYYAVPKAGIELTLEVKSGERVKLIAVDQSYGFPELPGTPLNPKPDYLTPSPSQLSDSTIVSKAYTF